MIRTVAHVASYTLLCTYIYIYTYVYTYNVIRHSSINGFITLIARTHARCIYSQWGYNQLIAGGQLVIIHLG